MARESPDSPPDAEVGQDLAFERLSWAVQRAAWVIAVLVLVAALAGVFGHGPLSNAAATSADGSLRVEYQRVLRNQAPSELRVRVTPGAEGRAVVWLAQDYLRKVRLRQVTPEPERAEVRSDRTVYTFHAAAGAGGGEVEVVFHFDVQAMGRQRLEMGRGDGGDGRAAPGAVSAPQFILP